MLLSSLWSLKRLKSQEKATFVILRQGKPTALCRPHNRQLGGYDQTCSVPKAKSVCCLVEFKNRTASNQQGSVSTVIVENVSTELVSTSRECRSRLHGLYFVFC